MQLHQIVSSTSWQALYAGPDLAFGKMATIFYFVTSAEESLSQHPYNSPVEWLLSKEDVRIISFDIPGHGKGFNSKDAISYWSSEIAKGNDLLSPYFDSIAKAITEIALSIQSSGAPIGLMGLSRGAYVATQIAGRLEIPSRILGFAPLTDLHVLDEFQQFGSNNLIVERLQLKKVIPNILATPLRFFIGNHDTRVGTSHCYSFIHELVKESYAMGLKSAPVELVVVPSLGMSGHGTSPRSFKEGAEWLYTQIKGERS